MTIAFVSERTHAHIEGSFLDTFLSGKFTAIFLFCIGHLIFRADIPIRIYLLNKEKHENNYKLSKFIFFMSQPVFVIANT